jgi:Fe2+ or Zn2+ uptake regulation protein
MHCYETDDKNAKVEDWMIEIVEKCAYSSINRERRAILEILADSPKELSASQIGSSRGLGLEKEGVETYLNPLFAVGLIKRNTSGNPFKWFMEDEHTKDFIKQVSGSVPQIKLKEIDEEEVSQAQKDFDDM